MAKSSLLSKYVLSNSIDEVVDVLKPHLAIRQSNEIRFDVGTHIDGEPHIGTYAVIALAFLLAEAAKNKFGLPTSVTLTVLDNGPFEKMKIRGNEYYYNYGFCLNKKKLDQLKSDYYGKMLEFLFEKTSVPFKVQTYRSFQKNREFRRSFLKIMQQYEKIAPIVSPKGSLLKIRTECPICGLVEKEAYGTKVLEVTDCHVAVQSICPFHGKYKQVFSEHNNTYLDLNSLFRNLTKEIVYTFDKKLLGVMIKGADWVPGSQIVDLAHGALGKTSNEIPCRIFTPKITMLNGEKISKTILKKHPHLAKEINEKLISIKNSIHSPIFNEQVLFAVRKIISDPNHFYRSYTHSEFEKIMLQNGRRQFSA